MKTDFVKIAAANIPVKLGNVSFHTEEIINTIDRAARDKAQIVCFPELCLTGYSCQDLLSTSSMLESSLQGLRKVCDHSRLHANLILLVGLPLEVLGKIYNSTAVVTGGKVVAFVAKTMLTDGFEHRVFTSSDNLPKKATVHWGDEIIPIESKIVFHTPNFTFGVQIGEEALSLFPPSTQMALEGAEIIFTPSSFIHTVGRSKKIENILLKNSDLEHTAHIISSSGFGESTQDVVRAGQIVICEDGEKLSSCDPFEMHSLYLSEDIDLARLRHRKRIDNSHFTTAITQICEKGDVTHIYIDIENTNHIDRTLARRFNPLPFLANNDSAAEYYEEILNIQSEALAARIAHTCAKSIVLGISGGLDSTLALLVCTRAMDRLSRERKNVIGVTMPGFGTTGRTYTNAIDLMKHLGITILEIPIGVACSQHLAAIGHDGKSHDVTYENAQARERTQILMDIANLHSGFVVGTGDLSELALGWATYGGDHLSMYGVNASVSKTLVKQLCLHISEHTSNENVKNTLNDIINTPISPELIPSNNKEEMGQITEDLVGPYELHDFFLYHFLRHGASPKHIFQMALIAFDGKDTRVSSHSAEEIKHWLTVFFRRFFAQQFKRSCLPDGPSVGEISLSPRGGFCMPSDASAHNWLMECDSIEIQNLSM